MAELGGLESKQSSEHPGNVESGSDIEEQSNAELEESSSTIFLDNRELLAIAEGQRKVKTSQQVQQQLALQMSLA